MVNSQEPGGPEPNATFGRRVVTLWETTRQETHDKIDALFDDPTVGVVSVLSRNLLTRLKEEAEAVAGRPEPGLEDPTRKNGEESPRSSDRPVQGADTRAEPGKPDLDGAKPFSEEIEASPSSPLADLQSREAAIAAFERAFSMDRSELVAEFGAVETWSEETLARLRRKFEGMKANLAKKRSDQAADGKREKKEKIRILEKAAEGIGISRRVFEDHLGKELKKASIAEIDYLFRLCEAVANEGRTVEECFAPAFKA